MSPTSRLASRHHRWRLTMLGVLVSLLIVAATPAQARDNCLSTAEIQLPGGDRSFAAGRDLYVRVEPERRQDVERVTLLLNGRVIRRETRYPYEWAKGSGSSDGLLRNLAPGSYQLQALVEDECGDEHLVETIFSIYENETLGNGNGDAPPADDGCEFRSWFKYPKDGESYPLDSSIYVRIDTVKYQDIEHMTLYINGSRIRREQRYPYEWGGENGADRELRPLDQGIYTLRVRIRTKCDTSHDYDLTFFVE